MMDHHILDDHALDVLFRTARTHTAWQDRPVSDVLLEAVYQLAKWGATAGNSTPARFVFVRSPEAKARLKPFLAPGNVDKTMAAPVTVIVGYDLAFPEYLPTLYPHTNARSWYEGNDALIRETAFRNGSLQGAYLMLAARALGLDCGPMSGFDAAGVKAAFFEGTKIEPNFLCNLGYGDASKLHPRLPRLEFDTVCTIL